MMRRSLVVACAGLGLVCPASASAVVRWFHSPSGNIECGDPIRLVVAP